ncbi:ATP-binding protein [Streptomyces cinerochromogenes]|nr:YfjP family GTPase [Streptomyces cinerochromogenes]GGS45884.1 ATP-binding protein [Streptomyces cinerochromogenes]
MTAVTDQDHTDHTEHMRRDHGSAHSSDHGSNTGDRGERRDSRGLEQARSSLLKGERGEDEAGRSTAFSQDAGKKDNGEKRDEGEEGVGGGDAGGSTREGAGADAADGRPTHMRNGSNQRGEREHSDLTDQGYQRYQGDQGDQGDQRGLKDLRDEKAGPGAEREHPARGYSAEESGGVSVPRPHTYSPQKPRPAADDTPSRTGHAIGSDAAPSRTSRTLDSDTAPSRTGHSIGSDAAPSQTGHATGSDATPLTTGHRSGPDAAPLKPVAGAHAAPPQPATRADAAPPKPPAGSDAAPGRPGTDATPPKSGTDPDSDASAEAWDDGLIARRVTEANAAALAAERASAAEPAHRGPGSHAPAPLAYDGPLRSRLDALRELVGLSRTRLDSRTLAEAGRVLDEAAARRKLSGRHTVVALAGATGSGKSQLFNALAGVPISETGVRRPTTAAPIACSWSDGAAGLIDRLGIPGRLRRRPLHGPDAEGQLRGLVLVDLPDHDSAAVQHREQVDRILKLVDAVIWVVDPEKYADAVLHERYLRPMAGHAEVMFVVLNQVDRLPGDAAHQVLDDLRRLLDEDGIALGEYGEPGATVLALSALTGEGVGDLREALGQFVAERGAAARRVSADVDAAAAELRPVYATGRRIGLSEEAREEFAARLADAVGATAAGEAAERAWLRNANRACGTPWLRLWRWYQGRGDSTTGRHQVRNQTDEEATARQRVEQAVRTVSDRASAGLPVPWAQAVREAAVRGSQGLSEALDELAARSGLPTGRPPRPGWWPVAVLVQAAMTLLQVAGGAWLAGQIAGLVAPNLGVPVLLMVCGIIGGPLVEWACRMAARGPARRYGQEAERRLREAAASCGRARVLDPVASELLRYREVREQYGRVVRSGAAVG